MFEFDEWGELLWIPLALLAGVLILRWCGPLLGGASGGRGLASFGQVNGLVHHVGSRAASILRSVQDQASWRSSSGNQSFDAHERDARRCMNEDREAFRRHRDQAERTREQAEFEAFVAERDKHRL